LIYVIYLIELITSISSFKSACEIMHKCKELGSTGKYL